MKSFIKKLLPRPIWQALKRARERLGVAILAVFSRSRWMSSLYYLLFSREFGREHQAVLKGRLRYLHEHQSLDLSSSPLLRRNIHRLEKGLIMQPRREVFAENYIEQTVNLYVQLKQKGQACDDELKWAGDVLTSYFAAVSTSPAIDRARGTFASAQQSSPGEWVPYAHHQKTQNTIDDQTLEALFQQRRSTRWFDSKVVEMQKLDRAIQLATWAPSACNRQPFEFYLTNQPEQAAELANMAVGTGGFAHNVPAIIAVVGNLAAYPFEKDRHLIYIDGSLAAMQLMLAFETLGLSSCPFNWPDIEARERAIGKVLRLPPEKRVIMLIGVGYAQQHGMIPYSQKKPVSSLKVDISHLKTAGEGC